MGRNERMVAGWVLEERLGSGGFGEVWRARRRHVDFLRAVKLTPVASERNFETWRHEISRLEALSHPNIVRFYDADLVTEEGPYQDYAWIATELCTRSLSQELQRQPDHLLGVDQVDQLVEQMLAALAAAHEGDSVHRDIKPANILLHENGTWKLCDFGTARLLPQGQSHAHTMVVGTSPYMSAEAHRGRQDYAADLYGLAVTAHEALCGQRLHPRPDGMSDSEYVKHILDTPPVVSADLPARWQTVVRALAGLDHEATLPAADLRDWFRETRGASPPPADDAAIAGSRPTGQIPVLPDGLDRETVNRQAEDRLASTAAIGAATRDMHGSTTAWQAPTAHHVETRVSEPDRPRQVFVPAPAVPPAPASPSPAPASSPAQRPQHAPAAAPVAAVAQPASYWQPAPVWRRVVALCIDAAIVGLAAYFIWLIIWSAMLTFMYDRVSEDITGGNPSQHCVQVVHNTPSGDCVVFEGDAYVRDERLWSTGQVSTAAGLAVLLFVGGLQQGRKGRTLGKRMLGLRVVGRTGGPPGVGRALVRTALLVVDAFLWFVPGVGILGEVDASSERQWRRRVGDRVARTYVVRKPGR